MRPLAALAAAFVTASVAASASATPEAHLLRVDARAAPVITTVIDLAQHRRVADVVAPCARLAGDAQLDCLGDVAAQPSAFFSPFAFMEKNAAFTILSGKTDQPLAFESMVRWGDASNEPRVGTAWLVVVDATATMGPRLDDAKEIAGAFISSLRQSDVVDVVVLDDAGVAADSKWSAAKAQAGAVLASVQRPFAAQGPTRPLAEALKAAATDRFRDLFASAVAAPLHQAMVVISDGDRGDAGAAASAASVREHLGRGRFPATGPTPKMPVPVISVWLPGQAGATRAGRDFMQGLANPELGGYFTAVREGRKGHGPGVVAAVRSRFDKMHLVKWRLTCTVFGQTQSFKLLFANTSPPIGGDSTFLGVPYNAPPPQPCKK
jgi:hypothetical protein